MYKNKDKVDEVWINYCGMPVCFGWKEFSTVTGLKCYPPSQVIPILTKKAPRTPKKGKDKLRYYDDLVPIVGPSFKNKNLIEALKGKQLSKKHKKSLCLVCFVHNILWGRDTNNNISAGLIKLSEDLEVFSSYPWGYERFKIVFQYLLTPLAPKTINLYGFSWAFMVQALSPRSDSDSRVPLSILHSCGDGVVGGGSSAAGGANDAHLTIFKTNHYEYDHTGYTYFASPSECFAWKCQYCRTKHDVVINAINALTTSIKE
ncbi:hypothetical protein BC332_13163 [Capsicum chinense]|nr:hypothetical protein BC332_13163 [Capsicum chinense]